MFYLYVAFYFLLTIENMTCFAEQQNLLFRPIYSEFNLAIYRMTPKWLLNVDF